MRKVTIGALAALSLALMLPVRASVKLKETASEAETRRVCFDNARDSYLSSLHEAKKTYTVSFNAAKDRLMTALRDSRHGYDQVVRTAKSAYESSGKSSDAKRTRDAVTELAESLWTGARREARAGWRQTHGQAKEAMAAAKEAARLTWKARLKTCGSE